MQPPIFRISALYADKFEPIPRFYLSEVLLTGRAVSLPDDVVRHLHVLRLKPDGEIILFNGDDRAHPTRLGVLGKHHAMAEILREEEANNESPLNIILVQVVSSGGQMDFTLQKDVELGIGEIRPVFSEHCVVRLDGGRATRRMARQQEIVVSACEQSGRNAVPRALPLVSYQEALRQMPSEKTKLLMSVRNARKLNRIAPSPDGLIFMVGPEGNWTEDREQQVFDTGFQAVMLGPRILRTEMTSLAAIVAMQTLWDSFVQKMWSGSRLSRFADMEQAE